MANSTPTYTCDMPVVDCHKNIRHTPQDSLLAWEVQSLCYAFLAWYKIFLNKSSLQLFIIFLYLRLFHTPLYMSLLLFWWQILFLLNTSLSRSSFWTNNSSCPCWTLYLVSHLLPSTIYFLLIFRTQFRVLHTPNLCVYDALLLSVP